MESNKIKVFIVPGIGDDMHGIGRRIESGAIEAEVFAVGYSLDVDNPEDYYESVLGQFLQKIDDAYANGYEIVLIGASAGASFVINALMARYDKIKRVINLSGRITTEEGLALKSFERYEVSHPLFAVIVRQTEHHLRTQRYRVMQKFVAFVPLFDELVPPKTMFFDGARIRRILTVEHLVNIGIMFVPRPFGYQKSLIEEIMS